MSAERRISNKELLAGIRHLEGILPLPYHLQIHEDILMSGGKTRAIPPEIRNLARNLIRYRDRQGLPSLLSSQNPKESSADLD